MDFDTNVTHEKYEIIFKGMIYPSLELIYLLQI